VINAGISRPLDSIGQTSFDPGNAWHTYRLEGKGTQINLSIDGRLVLVVNDNRYLSGGQLGFKSFETQLSISNFKVIAL
jgi:hypothetical protein